ncbi:NAD-dependent epimerase/dehydratase family protein, partial [Vibrio splendidus]
MSILITGALGFLGRVIVDNLRGKEKLVLLGRIDKGENSDLFYKDVNSVTDYSDCLTGVGCIIHCAARVHIMGDESNDPLNDYREVNTLGTLNLARQAVEFGVKRFIFISSIKANGEDTNHIPPFNTESSRSPKDFYAQSKSEAEIQLMALAEETGLEVVIIRPPLVYGAGVRANFASLMKLVSKGFPLPFGSIRSNKRSL